MKKFSFLIALVLLAVAGTGFAVTCAYDNVPAATLLVPYFRVASNGITDTSAPIPDGGTDTLLAITNVSNTGLIAHVTVWNKYSLAVLDFNVPLTAFDVAYFTMKGVLNGHLNVNANTQGISPSKDNCGINQTSGVYNPVTGFGPTTFIRFPNPTAPAIPTSSPGDHTQSISVYQDPAFSGTFRKNVWDSLDESGDVTAFTAPGPYTLDNDNKCAGSVDGSISGDFSGYVTIDVVNYCTNFFPDLTSPLFYQNDAIATAGWSVSGYTPNALMGDIFYLDPNANGGNISGDPMIALEFDSRLNDWTTQKTFYGRYSSNELVAGTAAPIAFRFLGDGREPLGDHYGFRYMSDPSSSLQTWAIVWRSDLYHNPITDPDTSLCEWWGTGGNGGHGLYDTPHQLAVSTYDNDENQFVTSGGPSPGQGSSPLYVFLETQRISLLSNGDINPGQYPGGWIDMRFPTDVQAGFARTNQAYVGVQHSGAGLAISVGHSATLLNEQFLCLPDFHAEPGNLD